MNNSKNMRSLIGLLSLVFAFIYTTCITFLPISDNNIRFADVSQGFIMGTILAQVYNFYFGTSQGSVDKNKFLKEETEEKIESE